MSQEAAGAIRLGRPLAWAARRLLDTGLALALAAYLLATGATFFGRHDWRADLVTHFRPHLVAAALVLGLLLVLAGRRRWVLPLAAAAAVHMAMLLWPVPAPVAVPGGQALRLVEFNLLTDNSRYRAVEDYLRAQRPDILVLAEVNGGWRRVVQRLEADLPYSTQAIGVGSDTVVLSRFPLRNVSARMPTDAEGQQTATPVVRVEINLGRQRLVLYAVHPPSPMSEELWRMRNDEHRWVAGRVAAEPSGLPVIVAGDFNQSPWSPWHRAFVKRSGLRDAAGTSWPTATRHPFHPFNWRLLGVPIDRVAVRPGIGVTSFRVGPELGSDHDPLTVDLTLPPA